MAYPKMPDFMRLTEAIRYYAQMKHEYGAKGIAPILRNAEQALKATVKEMQRLPVDRQLAEKEPSGLTDIRSLRPRGPRRMLDTIDDAQYAERLQGALLGRFAGCILGAIVEGWEIEAMASLAKQNGDDFPPKDYWSATPMPYVKRYDVSPRESFTRSKLDGVPVDDDLIYTQLGLLILEDYGPQFTLEDVGKAWLKYLPHAAGAEELALRNLRKGIPASKAAEIDNYWWYNIGGAIRSDPWGYVAPGWPEKAAELAWRDASISHRRQGIHAEMFFSATIAAALVMDNPIEALKIGLTEIPKDCSFARAVKWALKMAPQIRNYRQARAAVDKRFAGMDKVHSINNACLDIWGLSIGGRDFTRVIGETVAMGLDSDCTTATAGSIAGAIVGKKGIPEHWYRRFNNKAYSYITNHRLFHIDDLLKRFAKQARLIAKS